MSLADQVLFRERRSLSEGLCMSPEVNGTETLVYTVTERPVSTNLVRNRGLLRPGKSMIMT